MECNYKNLETTFQNMIDAGWNVENNLKWGYFFINKSPDLLKKFCDLLLKEGYKFEDLRKIDDSNDWILCVYKIEIHTPERLHERNQHFNNLADLLKIDSYDGWDVGPL